MTDTPSRASHEAVEKVIRGIGEPDVEGRYPDRTHFVPADHPRHGEMVTRALFGGDPVVLVYPDGREMLFKPERTVGVLALALLVVAALSALRRRGKADAEVIRMPPRTRIEARDAGGLPVAA